MMNPSQAWQAAIGQLQIEMPKAAFDTWVSDAEFVSYEDGIFTISVRNSYARDWMADRLTSTIAKLLTGIMNQTVDVYFIVDDTQIDTDLEDDSEIAVVEAIFDLPYDEIVGTGIIAIPAYFGRYHLRELGPNLAWMVVGFRQAAYSAGRRSGSRKLHISERTIARWSGINRRTFRRRKKKPDTWEKLNGFVSLSSTKATWVSGNGDIPNMAAQTYRVQMIMPLTVAHAHSLRQWFLSHLEITERPEAVFQLAIQTPLEELFNYQDNEPANAKPITVMQLVADLFGDELSEANLKVLAQRLHQHIMPPNDQIIITHFFAENLLPLLGPGPAWMLTLLRDRCYLNRETGEYRNRATVPGGWSEVANWMGLKRPSTVWEWLHGAKRQKNKPHNPPLLSAYISEVKQPARANDFSDSPRIFEIVQEEIPVTIMSEVAEAAQELGDWAAGFNDVITRLSPMKIKSRECPLCNHANVPYGVTRLSPDRHANVPYEITRLSPNHHANVPYLSSLTPGSINQNSKNKTTNTPSDNGSGKTINTQFDEVQVGTEWEWDLIFSLNPEINPSDQEILREHDVTRFVAWLVYGFSKEGNGINMPVMFAVRRVQDGANVPPDFRKFTRYSPLDMHDILRNRLAGHWEKYLPQSVDKRAELKLRLLGISQ